MLWDDLCLKNNASTNNFLPEDDTAVMGRLATKLATDWNAQDEWYDSSDASMNERPVLEAKGVGTVAMVCIVKLWVGNFLFSCGTSTWQYLKNPFTISSKESIGEKKVRKFPL